MAITTGDGQSSHGSVESDRPVEPSDQLHVMPGALLMLVVPLEFPKGEYVAVAHELERSGWVVQTSRVTGVLMPPIAGQVRTRPISEVSGRGEGDLFAVYQPAKDSLKLIGRSLLLRSGRVERPFTVNAARLFLCRFGFAFAIVEVKTDDADPRTWQDLQHRLRLLGGESQRTSIDARVRPADDAEPRPWRDLVAEVWATDSGSLRCTETTAFIVAYVLLKAGEADASDVFAHLYRLRRFFHSGQVVSALSFEDDLWPRPLPYGDNIDIHVSIEGLGIYGVGAPCTEFFTMTFPDHIRRAYVLGFALVLLQRRALLHISERLVKDHHENPGRGDLDAALKATRGELLEMVTRSRFAQVLPTQNHHRVYAECLTVFEVDRLECEVLQEVNELSAYVRQLLEAETLAETQRRNAALEQFNRRIAGAGLLLATSSGVVTALGLTAGTFFKHHGSIAKGVGLLLAVTMILSITVGAILVTRPEHPPSGPSGVRPSLSGRRRRRRPTP